MIKDKKLLFIFGILIIFFITFYFLFFQKPLSPEQELLQLSRNMTDLDSFSVDFELRADFLGDYNYPNVGFSGIVNIDRLSETAEIKTDTEITDVGMTANLKVDFKYVDDSIYMDIITFPYLSLQMMSDDVSLLSDNKILIKEDLIKDLNQLLFEMFENAEREPRTLAQIKRQLYSLFLEAVEHNVFEVEEVEKDTLNGQSVKKYTVLVNSDNLENFIFKVMERDQVYQFLSLEEQEKEKLKEEIRNWSKETFKNYQFSVWGDSQTILKVETISEVEFPEDEFLGEEVPEKVIFVSSFVFSNFNQNFEIKAPEEYLKLEDILESVLSPFFFLQEEIVTPN